MVFNKQNHLHNTKQPDSLLPGDYSCLLNLNDLLLPAHPYIHIWNLLFVCIFVQCSRVNLLFKLDTFIISLSGRFFSFAIVRTGEKASKSKTQWHNHHQSRNSCHKPSDRIRLTVLCIMTVLLSFCSCMISICIHIFSFLWSHDNSSLFFCNLFSSPMYQKACSRTTVLLSIYSKNIRLSICKSKRIF